MAGLGTKGGGSLIFRNDPETQTVTLSGGSERGHITLAAGSPTTAAVVADFVNTTSTVNNFTSLFSSSSSAGYQYSVKAAYDAMDKIKTVLASIRALTETVSDAANLAYQSYDDEDHRQRTELAGNIAALTDYCIAPLQTVVQGIANVMISPTPDPRLPDTNLIAITGSVKGSQTVWNTKEPFELLSLRGLLLPFLTLMKTVRGGSSFGGKIFAEKEKAEKENENPSDAPQQNAHNKRAATGLALTTPISKLVSDICATILTGRAMYKSSSAPSQGILVDNKDSYVDILAETWAGISAKRGPLILESMESRVADEMRCKVPTDLNSETAKKCFESEITGKVIGTFLEQQAVLLHGKLIRGISDELGFQATDTAVMRSGGNIKLVTGDNVPDQGAVPAGGSAYRGIRNRFVDFEFDRDKTKGIHIQATAPGSTIRLSTKDDSSPILLAHGVGDNEYDAPTGRKLMLNDEGVFLSEKDGGFLAIKKKSFVLQAGDDSGVTVKENLASLTLDEDIGLSLEKNAASLCHTTAINIETNQHYIKLGPQGIDASTKISFKVDAPLTRIGG
jgi:hypothetical protein